MEEDEGGGLLRRSGRGVDGQALVANEPRESAHVIEADEPRHNVIARCAQPPVQVREREWPAVAGGRRR